MSFKQLFFVTVFLVCYVHSYRSESERSVPAYEPSVDQTQDNKEPVGTASVNRVDRGITSAADESQEFSQPEEGFEQKPNKKDKHFGHTSDSKTYKNSKKSTSAEPGEENIYNKEFKNVSHKKSKGYNKKYNKYHSEEKVKYEEVGADLPADVQPHHESIHKRFSPSSKGTDSAPSERVERSVKLEPESIAEEQPQEVKYQKQHKNRKSDMKSGKYGKYSNKSKNGSKRQKRNYDYFGFWA